MEERIRNLTVSDIPEARALWELCFHDSPSFLDWFFLERYRPETSLCLETGGKIGCILHGCPMRVRVRNAVLPGLIIGGVATRPEARGHGYMHRVLKALMYLARDNGIPLVFHTPAHIPVYQSAGHLPCTDKLIWTAPDSAPDREPDWQPIPDAASLASCYNACTAHYSGSVLRNENDMALRLADYRADGVRCLVHKTGETLDGYLLAQQDADTGAWTAPEAFAASPAVYEALLRQLPRGSEAKLPPDAGVPGERLPQGVMGVADVSELLSRLCGDEVRTFAVTDPVVSANNGTFNGRGRRVEAPAQYEMTAGNLMQMLAGYAFPDERFPRRTCFCSEEY